MQPNLTRLQNLAPILFFAGSTPIPPPLSTPTLLLLPPHPIHPPLYPLTNRPPILPAIASPAAPGPPRAPEPASPVPPTILPPSQNMAPRAPSSASYVPRGSFYAHSADVYVDEIAYFEPEAD